MIVKKNGIYQTKIEDLSSDGRGIGRIEGLAVFAAGVIPGDTAEIKITETKKNYACGKLVEITEPSIHRVPPKCAFFKNCGGCALLCMDYAAQLKQKTKMVKNCLERIGGFKNAGEITKQIIGMENPYNYRNKARFHVKKIAFHEGASIGFYSAKSHDIADLDSCAVLDAKNDKIIDIFKKFINKNIEKFPPYDEMTGKGLLQSIFTRVGFHSGEIMACIKINGNDFPDCGELTGELAGVEGMTSIVLCNGGNKTKTLWGKSYITDYITDKKFKISADSFYQINPAQTEVLYKEIQKYAALDKSMVCADAYCGIGTITVMLAPLVKKIYGVEIIEQAVSDAVENAKINNIKNAEFIAGKSEEVIPKLIAGVENIDLLVVDPPRGGCDIKLIESLLKSTIQKLIYVSCDPATLARDLKLLTETAYELVTVQPVDMFPHTTHVETVVLLCRKNSFTLIPLVAHQ